MLGGNLASSDMSGVIWCRHFRVEAGAVCLHNNRLRGEDPRGIMKRDNPLGLNDEVCPKIGLNA